MQKKGTKGKKQKRLNQNVHESWVWSPPLKNLNALPGRDAEYYAKEYVGWESEKRWYRYGDISVYSFVSYGHVE